LEGQGDGEARALGGHVLRHDLSAVIGHDAIRRVQAEAMPFGFGREVRLEHLGQQAIGMPGPVSEMVSRTSRFFSSYSVRVEITRRAVCCSHIASAALM
jgi:hypothetical protein